MHRSPVRPQHLTTQVVETALVIKGTTTDAEVRTTSRCHPSLTISIPPMVQLEVAAVAMETPKMVEEDLIQEETNQTFLATNGP